MDDSISLQVWIPQLPLLYKKRAGSKQTDGQGHTDYVSPAWYFGGLRWVVALKCLEVGQAGWYKFTGCVRGEKDESHGGHVTGKVMGQLSFSSRTDQDSNGEMAKSFDIPLDGGEVVSDRMVFCAGDMFAGSCIPIQVSMRLEKDEEIELDSDERDVVGGIFRPTLRCGLEPCFDSSEFADVEVITDDSYMRYSCHKVVLASVSYEFVDVLRKLRAPPSAEELPQLHISGVDGGVVKDFLKYIYGETVYMGSQVDGARQLLKLAQQYRVADLEEKVQQYLKAAQQDSEAGGEEGGVLKDACGVLMNPRKFPQAKVLKAMTDVMIRLDAARTLDSFLQLPAEGVDAVVRSVPIRAPEHTILSAILSWAKWEQADTQYRTSCLQKLLQHVHIEGMESDSLEGIEAMLGEDEELNHHPAVSAFKKKAAEELADRRRQPKPWPTGEDDEPLDGEEHEYVSCDICHVSPIKGIRYRSLTLEGFDVCSRCVKLGCSEGAKPFEAIHKHSIEQCLEAPRHAKQRCSICGVLPIVGEPQKSSVNSFVSCKSCADHPLMHEEQSQPASGSGDMNFEAAMVMMQNNMASSMLLAQSNMLSQQQHARMAQQRRDFMNSHFAPYGYVRVNPFAELV